jgi:hypothetical protein
MDKDAYQKKTSLAAELSKKEETKPPAFEEKWAVERKNRELHGNSAYPVEVKVHTVQ